MPVYVLLQIGKLFGQKLDAVGKGLPYPIRGVSGASLLLTVTLALQVLSYGFAPRQQCLQYPCFRGAGGVHAAGLSRAP